MSGHVFHGKHVASAASVRLDAFIEACLAAKKYEVDAAGIIWNCRFRGRSVRRRLAQWRDPDGYMQCELYWQKQRRIAKVHRVVLIASKGRPTSGVMDANHRNGRKSDNRPCNLEWVTHSDNLSHAYSHGLISRANCRGEGNRAAVLREADIQSIFDSRSHGMTLARIAGKFGVAISTIHSVVTGKSWRHLERAA